MNLSGAGIIIMQKVEGKYRYCKHYGYIRDHQDQIIGEYAV